MLIYIILFFYFIVSTIIFHKHKKIHIFLLMLPLFLLCILRSVELGLTDTKGVYYQLFNSIQQNNFVEIIKFRGINETFFYLFYKIITVIKNDYRFLLTIVAIPYIVSVGRHIYKYSNNYLLSTIVFTSMYYLFSFYLIKQCIAISILIFSYKYIVNKKVLKFSLCVLIATMFHKMSLIFIVAYPFAIKNKFSIKNYIYILIAFIAAILFPNLIYLLISKLDYTNTIINYINHGIYSVQESSPYLGLILNLTVIIYCNIFCYKKNEERANIDLNLLTLGCVFFAFSFIVVEFYRIALFFSIFSITRISNFNIKIKNALIYKLIVIILFIIYFLLISINNYNANPYMFYWR